MQLDIFEAALRRDAAFDTVLENAGSWKAQAYDAIASLEPGWSGIGEELRLMLTKKGLPPPHHHNAWGAIVCGAVRMGLLSATGEWRKMQTPNSHARKSQVLRRGGAI